MLITNEIARFNLDEYVVKYGSQHQLCIADLAGEEVQSFPLINNQLLLTIQNGGSSGKRDLVLGTGDVTVPFFTRNIKLQPELNTFSIANKRTGIGVGDLRDLRVSLQYDLEKTCIAMKSDGVYLEFSCPGEPSNGPVEWYKEVQGN